MSQSVDKLKQLLFAPESEAIADLSKRIDVVFDRAGTTERFRSSVASVLDAALREAEVTRHEQVSDAIAPLIVKTVKSEIRNSTDDLVEALYPATGRMVKSYVASAIKDLTRDINRKLSANPVMLRVNALLTGRSVGELALAFSQQLSVDDVFLIRRATGELVSRWPQGTPHSNSDHVLGGVLTAINEFTAEAFKAEGGALRQIDLGGQHVFLRVSPNFLLAAKCSGTPPSGAEQVFDEEFLRLIDRHNAVLERDALGPAGQGQGGGESVSTLREVAERLRTRLADIQAQYDKLATGVRPLTLLAILIGVPLVAWLAWSLYVEYRMAHVVAVAHRVVAEDSDMRGYPVDIHAGLRGQVVTLSGLAPTAAVKSRVIGAARAQLPAVEVLDQLSAVPIASADVRPLLAAMKTDQQAFEQLFEQRIAAATAERLAGLDALKSRLETENDRLRAEIAALPKPPPPAPPPPAPKPRQLLQDYVRSHAVFFTDGVAFRNEALAKRTLDELAQLIRNDDSLVRVVGYTDEVGTPAQNAQLGKNRADVIAEALRARGVPAGRLTTLPRTSPVSTTTGSGSANRRVEFEVGFVGEGAP